MHFLSSADKAMIAAINAEQRKYGLPTIKHSIWTGKLLLVPPANASPDMVEKCRLANTAKDGADLDKLLAATRDAE